MASNDEYEGRARAMDHLALAKLWSEIQARTVSGWPPGRALEYLVIRGFELSGAVASYPYSVRLPLADDSRQFEQIDGMVHVGGLWCLCEAKDTSEPQNIEPIAKLRNQLTRRPAGNVGLVFSVAGFTEPAKLATNFMGEHAILLWTGADIDWAVRHSFAEALLRKYRAAVETGLRDHALLPEDVT